MASINGQAAKSGPSRLPIWTHLAEIYNGTNVRNGSKVAIKLESIKAAHPQLHSESRVYKILSGGPGIPKLHWMGVEGTYNVMVIDLLGLSLEDLFAKCNKRFSLKTVLMLADQMIQRLQFMHSRCMLHRDIKPDNFLMGVRRRADLVHVIDFGLSKRYQDARTRAHIPYRENKQLTGTPRYASINAHLGIE